MLAGIRTARIRVQDGSVGVLDRSGSILDNVIKLAPEGEFVRFKSPPDVVFVPEKKRIQAEQHTYSVEK